MTVCLHTFAVVSTVVIIEHDLSNWAYDLRPWEGGRWNNDEGDPSMRELFPKGNMVHIGFKSQWNQGETARRSWTEPLVENAEKAKWKSFNDFRYVCCADLSCGVRVSVIQGSYQDWHFRRQRPLRGSGKPQRCVNQKSWSSESVFHSLTKMNIRRILSLGTWKDEFNIKEVHTETQITFERNGEQFNFRPDVLLTLQDDSKIYLEVVYTNKPTRLKHELYGENMVVIDLTDGRDNVLLSDYFMDDRVRNFRQWVRDGGIEEALRRELTLENRRQAYRSREVMYLDQNRTVESEFFQEIWDQVKSRGVIISSKSKEIIEEALRPGMSKQEIQKLFDEASLFEIHSSDKSKFIDSWVNLLARESYFSKLAVVLESSRFGNHEFNITLEEAMRVLGVLQEWHSLDWREKISYTIENNISEEGDLLRSLGLDLSVFDIEDLDDWTLLNDYYWKLVPGEWFNYMTRRVADQLYWSVFNQRAGMWNSINGWGTQLMDGV
jgi:hypothetical protein